MTNAPHIFDYALLDAHRRRAFNHLNDDSDFLWQELAHRLVDRLDDVKRTFPRTLDLGAHHTGLKEMLKGKYGIERLVHVDGTHGAQGAQGANSSHTICAREETLPIAPASMDLIVSLASLQWINDLPGCLMQIRHALKPDGLFMTLMPGEETLTELRQSLDAAMLECYGGISPRVSPMLNLQDAADLMQRAGFTLPVIDRERIEICYSSPIKLMHDLRAMGQTNALKQRSQTPMTKTLLNKTCAYYAEHFVHPEGGVSATFDIITLTGWAPHPDQPKPLARGSAMASIKEIL